MVTVGTTASDEGGSSVGASHAVYDRSYISSVATLLSLSKDGHRGHFMVTKESATIFFHAL